MIPSRAVLRHATTLASLLALTTAVQANPASTVPSAGDPGNSIDLHVRLDYSYQLDRSTITRERVGTISDPLAAIPREKDLDFTQSQHVITPRADLSVFQDTWLSLALPITIGQARELAFADGVNAASSSTFTDGLLTGGGFDARDPSAAPPGGLAFRGVSRSGLDQIHLGLHVAPMNQRRDDTKPTWKLGGEVRLAVGGVAKMDALDPGSETAVGRGIHELRLYTSVARQFSRAEGWFEAFWMVPLTTTSSSLFQDPGFGSTNPDPSQQAGASFGIETYIVNDKANGNQIGLDVGARLVAHFEGRQYSEMWEVFALAGDSRGTGPLILDRDPVTSGTQALSYPGVSNVENYIETATRFALRGRLGKNVQFAAVADLAWKSDHAITFADAGIDLPTCDGSTSDCETDTNDVVNPSTREVNPASVSVIDLVGHRYFSTDNFALSVGVEAQVSF